MSHIYPRPGHARLAVFGHDLSASELYEGKSVKFDLGENRADRFWIEMGAAYRVETGGILFSPVIAPNYPPAHGWFFKATESNIAFQLNAPGLASHNFLPEKIVFHDDVEQRKEIATMTLTRAAASIQSTSGKITALALDRPEKEDLCMKLMNKKIICVSLPEFREIRFVLKTESECEPQDYLIIGVDKADPKKTRRMFFGPIENLCELTIGFRRKDIRLGEIIETDKGRLVLPGNFPYKPIAILNDQILELQDDIYVSAVSELFGDSLPRLQGAKRFEQATA